MMTLTSPAFEFSETIPKIHTGDGEDYSLALRWWTRRQRPRALR